MPKKRNPVTRPAAGQVIIQPKKMMATSFKLIAFVEPLHKPTAMVDPEMQCVVDTGMPSLEASIAVNMAPRVMQNPREGVYRVTRLPSAAMMWWPMVIRPMSSATAPYTRTQNGTSALLDTLPVE